MAGTRQVCSARNLRVRRAKFDGGSTGSEAFIGDLSVTVILLAIDGGGRIQVESSVNYKLERKEQIHNIV